MNHTRIITLGEIMLRLKPPGFERFFQTPMLETAFGGGEANVALSLAVFGLDVAFVTALPENPIADACIRYLRGYGVDTSLIRRSGDRMGIYFLEAGANQRPSSVVYDRANSAMAAAGPDDFDWPRVFAGAGWFHITGITPALSQSAADLALRAVQEAKQRGLVVSCDNSYRAKLWRYGRSAPDIMRDLVRSVDVLFANEEDCAKSLDVHLAEPALSGDERRRALAGLMASQFPDLRYQVMTVREGPSASHNAIAACLYNGESLLVSRRYDIANIVDRVGGGDALAAGLIYGMQTGMSDQNALEFAAAASCLKHSIPGDASLATVAEVRDLLQGDAAGRVRR
jgi:2-dehydro-3-deoxygluconokinase